MHTKTTPQQTTHKGRSSLSFLFLCDEQQPVLLLLLHLHLLQLQLQVLVSWRRMTVAAPAIITK